MTRFDVHPAANIFPMLDKKRFTELKADIENNGLIHPVILHGGKILDGRNRYKACVELGITPKTEDHEGNPWGYVWSANGQRRDITEIQRGAIHKLYLNGNKEYTQAEQARAAAIQAEANKKRSEAAKDKERKKDGTFQPVGVPEEHTLDKWTERPGRAARAEDAGVSPSTMAKVEAIANFSLELLEKVASGEIGQTEAARTIKLDKIKNSTPSIPKGKYNVIYADPPWQYGNTMPDYFTEQADHYPLMSVKDIAAMPIKEMTEDDAVLFLWVTSPILEECFQVIKAWGFKYKTSFIWDKVKHNMGHYSSVRHELLLLCIRGSFPIQNKKLFDSVYTEERGEHSAKPVFFYDMIEHLYPHSKKVELFARNERKGWQRHGNEV
jgi:N6-adenosine-specific RNA methylase IME4